MKKFFIRNKFKLLIALTLLFAAGIVSAANYGNYGYRVFNSSQQVVAIVGTGPDTVGTVKPNIEEHGQCRVVHNATGKGDGAFIPTKYPDEWQRLWGEGTNQTRSEPLPSGLTLTNCTTGNCEIPESGWAETYANSPTPSRRDETIGLAISNMSSNTPGNDHFAIYQGIRYGLTDPTILSYILNNFGDAGNHNRWAISGPESGTDYNVGNYTISWSTIVFGPGGGANTSEGGYGAEINLNVHNNNCT